MRFGNGEFYHDTSGNLLGPDVKVVYTLKNGDTVVEYLPAALASVLVLHDDLLNGEVYASAHIDYGDLIDSWGGSA